MVATPRSSLGDLGPFRGAFGDWEITDTDVTEVWTYRGGLTVTSAAFVAVVAAHLLPGVELPRAIEDAVCIGGALGLGVSLLLIHIYVTPLKRFLQDSSLPAYVIDNPWAVWLVGPLFASLAGVGFKEGFCYGKFEAFSLTLVLPVLLLGHLASALPEPAEKGLAVAAAALLALFAARKYGQPVKDDIGDGSVFRFLKLPPAEQQALLNSRRADDY
ncbi:hypothetical protein N2152v2_004207 [Parachlorella kessleri]